MQLNLEGASVFPNLPFLSPFHSPPPPPSSTPPTMRKGLSVASFSLPVLFFLRRAVVHPAPSCLFHSAFESILPFPPPAPSP